MYYVGLCLMGLVWFVVVLVVCASFSFSNCWLHFGSVLYLVVLCAVVLCSHWFRFLSRLLGVVVFFVPHDAYCVIWVASLFFVLPGNVSHENALGGFGARACVEDGSSLGYRDSGLGRQV